MRDFKDPTILRYHIYLWEIIYLESCGNVGHNREALLFPNIRRTNTDAMDNGISLPEKVAISWDQYLHGCT